MQQPFNLNDELIRRFSPIYERAFIGLNDNWQPFLNHGYKNLDNSELINYDSIDSKWANQINLYTHLIEHCKKYFNNYYNLDVLDIGCGFGYGIQALEKYYKFNSLQGLDYNSNFIKLASEKNLKENIKYTQGDAMKLPFKDNHVDIITNIESLHNYKFSHSFYKEAYRVLKPNGYLLCTDPFIPYKDDLQAEDYFNRAGFYMADKINITPMVINACKDDIQNFPKKHEGMDPNKIKYFTDLAEHKLEVYEKNLNVFLSYVFFKII